MDDCQVLKYLPVSIKAEAIPHRVDYNSMTFQYALYLYVKAHKEPPYLLLVGNEQASWAQEITYHCNLLGLAVKIFLEITDCSWAVMGTHGAIYNPGG